MRDKPELSLLQYQMHLIVAIMYKHHTIHPILETLSPPLVWSGEENLAKSVRRERPSFMLGCKTG